MQTARSQRQIAQLASENHTLKMRLAKLGQIEQYVDVLVQNNKNYQCEIAFLQEENRKMRGYIEEAVAERLHGQSSHQSELAIIRKSHQGQIGDLIKELKSILRDREEMQVNHRNIIEQLHSQYQSDMDRKRSELEEVDLQYQTKISKLNGIVREQQKQLQHLARELKETRIIHMEQVEILNAQNRQMREENSILQNQLNKSGKQLDVLSRQVKELTSQNEILSTRCLTIQQDKNDVILELKKQNKRLIAELEKVTSNLKALERACDQCQLKLSASSAQCQQLRRERNQLEAQGRRSLRVIEQTEYVLASTQEKLHSSQDRALKENQRNLDIIKELQSINDDLRRKLDNLNRQLEEKVLQVKDLLNSIERIQSRMIASEKEVSKLLDLNAQLNDKLNMEESEIEGNHLEIRSLREKLALYQSHNTTLEEMVEKQKRRAAHFDMERRDTGKIAECERDISAKYEGQIKRMVEEFYREKTNMIEQHNEERQRLKSFYEYTLLNKEELFNRKLQLLENQIETLRAHI